MTMTVARAYRYAPGPIRTQAPGLSGDNEEPTGLARGKRGLVNMRATTTTLHPCYTAAGFRIHWTADHIATLCGLPVAGGMGDTTEDGYRRTADCRNCLVKSGERRRNRR